MTALRHGCCGCDQATTRGDCYDGWWLAGMALHRRVVTAFQLGITVCGPVPIKKTTTQIKSSCFQCPRLHLLPTPPAHPPRPMQPDVAAWSSTPQLTFVYSRALPLCLVIRHTPKRSFATDVSSSSAIFSVRDHSMIGMTLSLFKSTTATTRILDDKVRSVDELGNE